MYPILHLPSSLTVPSHIHSNLPSTYITTPSSTTSPSLSHQYPQIPNNLHFPPSLNNYPQPFPSPSIKSLFHQSQHISHVFTCTSQCPHILHHLTITTIPQIHSHTPHHTQSSIISMSPSSTHILTINSFKISFTKNHIQTFMVNANPLPPYHSFTSPSLEYNQPTYTPSSPSSHLERDKYGA